MSDQKAPATAGVEGPPETTPCTVCGAETHTAGWHHSPDGWHHATDPALEESGTASADK